MPVGMSRGQYRPKWRYVVAICIFLLLLALEITGAPAFFEKFSDLDPHLSIEQPLWGVYDPWKPEKGTSSHPFASISGPDFLHFKPILTTCILCRRTLYIAFWIR
jgi:hypothetical protein